MTDTYGTSPAVDTFEARRGFDFDMQFTLRDQNGEVYPTFDTWSFQLRVSSEVGASPFFAMTTGTNTSNGGYIEPIADGETVEVHLDANDLAGFSASSGSSPDRYAYQITASSSEFGNWPLLVGDFVLGKSI